MTDNEQQSGQSEENQGGSTEGGQGSSDDGSTGTQAPEGFVSREELEREQARTRAFQSERDRLASELAARGEQGGNDGGTDGGNSGEGFDPDAFRRSLLRDVHGATSIATTAASLRTEFPHADPALFTPEALVGHASPEALRIAVEDSHNRVAGAVKEATEKQEGELLKKFAEQYGVQLQGEGGPQGNGQKVDGDPTVEQWARMSIAEQDAMEAKSPGITDRMLGATS